MTSSARMLSEGWTRRSPERSNRLKNSILKLKESITCDITRFIGSDPSSLLDITIPEDQLLIKRDALDISIAKKENVSPNRVRDARTKTNSIDLNLRQSNLKIRNSTQVENQQYNNYFDDNNGLSEKKYLCEPFPIDKSDWCRKVMWYTYLRGIGLLNLCLFIVISLTSMLYSHKRMVRQNFLFILPIITSLYSFELKPTTLSSKQAVVGHSVHLPCEFPYLPDNPVLILWYKNQNSKPFYSFDAREMVGGQHKVHDQFDLGRRANFSYKSSVSYATKHVLGYLILKNVTLKDTGNFTCRVDFQKAQTTMALLQLEVHEPIWRLSVVDARGREIGRETAPYEEGKRLYLTCRAYGGHPLPTVQWLTDNQVIATSSPQISDFIPPRNRWKNIQITSSELEVEAVLQLPALRREDQGRSFTCQANNSNLTPVRTKSITVNMSLRPIHIEIEGPSGPLWSGKEAQFHCRSWGSRPPAKLQWGPDSLLKMLNFQTSLDQNITVSRAQLIPTPDDDGVSINCTAVNPNVRSYIMSTAKKLVVYYAPRVEVQLASVFSANKIKEGDDMFFECKVQANPVPRSLIWLHEDQILEEDKENGILVQGHNLVLQKVSRNSRGKYQCKASNDVATVTSEPVYLKIMFVPECSEPQNLTVLVSEDEEVLLNCSVVSYPQPTEFIWRLNGSNGWQNIDSGKIKSHGLSSSFSYSAKTKRYPISMFNGANLRDTFEDNPTRDVNFIAQDYHVYRTSKQANKIVEAAKLRSRRRYRRNHPHYVFGNDNHETVAPSRNFIAGESFGVVYCLAKNSVGKQKEPCIFHISPAGHPGNLVSCSFANQSATTLRVTCIPGHDGGLKQMFRAIALDQDSRNVVANVTTSKPEFYLEGLIPGKDYLVIVSAFNSKGSSKPYVLEGFALKVAENKIKDENGIDSAPFVKLFLGAISGFLLVIAILIFVTRSRYKKRNRNVELRENEHNRNDEKDPLSPSSNPSIADNLNDDANKETSERDDCLQVPDITAHTPDSLGSVSTVGNEKHSTKRLMSSVDEVSQSSFGSSTPPPLLGLSNTFARIGGLPKTGSSHGFNSYHEVSHEPNVKTSTLPRHPKNDLQQTLPSVDLTKVSSNVNKYYTLKINCTRQSNESFV